MFRKLLFSLILLPFFTYAQPGTPAPGSISGTILDAATKEPVEFATIAVYRLKDTLPFNGAVTDDKGFFLLGGIPAGSYRVVIRFIGYHEKVLNPVVVSATVSDKYFEKILIEADSKILGEVEVKEQKNLVQMNVDKKVYNIEKDLTSKGGTATDVLQNIPSVQVDVDRNLSFRGSSNVTILIDGKPSTLTGANRTAVLDQIPAEDIERIEIISNPSAKYDAEGMAGIINIVTKKNNKQGYNGTITGSAGTRDKYNGGFTFNYRKGALNTSLSYNFQQNNFFSYGTSLRETPRDTIAFIDQRSDDYSRSYVHSTKLAVDYNIGKFHSLGGSLSLNTRSSVNTGAVNYLFQNSTRNTDSISNRTNSTNGDGLTYDAALTYRRTFKKPQRTLSADASYSNTADNSQLNAHQVYYFPGFASAGDDYRQRTSTINANKIYLAQLDYSTPINEKTRVETGAKNTYRLLDSDFGSESLGNGNPAWQNDAGRTNRFVYEENVTAAYGTYTTSFRNFGFSGGLRLEQTFSTSTQVTTTQRYEYNYLSYFPSAYLTYKMKNNQELQGGYSKRINRPRPRELNPFPEYTDPLNLMIGNPRLRPEYVNSFEVNYVVLGKKYTFSATGYFRHTDKMVTRFRTVNAEGISVTSSENLNSSRSYGVETVVTFDVFKWWKINASGNLYQINMNAGNLATGLNNLAIGGMGRFTSNFRIVKDLDLQVSYNYFRPGWALQGTIDPFQAMDMGLKKDIFKGKGSLNLRVSDVFNTRQFYVDTRGEGFRQDNLRKRESRIGYLSFTYRFGNEKFSIRPRKNEGREPQGGGDEGF